MSSVISVALEQAALDNGIIDIIIYGVEFNNKK